MSILKSLFSGENENGNSIININTSKKQTNGNVLKDLRIGYAESKEYSNKKVVIEGKIEVDDGYLDFENCDIIFKQYGYINCSSGNLKFLKCNITVERTYYNNEKLVYLENNSDCTIEDTEIRLPNNYAPGIGAVASKVFINNSIFEGCYSENPGAAIHATDCDLTIKKCTFDKCKSTRSGGGILFYANKEYATLVVEESIFNECSSDIKGGAISTGYDPKLFDSTYSEIKIVQSTFKKCSAKDYGGAIYLNYDPTNSELYSIDNCLFEDCNVGYYKGGAIYDSYVKAEVINCCFDNCKPDNFRNKQGSGNLAKCILGALTAAATVATGGVAGILIGGTGAALTAAGNAVNEDYKDELHRINEETQNIINKTKRSYEEKEQNAKDLVDKLISKKKTVYEESITRFANSFSKIKSMELLALEFDEKVVNQMVEYVKEVETVKINVAFDRMSNIVVGSTTVLFGGITGGFTMFGSSFAEGMMLSYKIDEAKAKYQEAKLKCEEIKVKELVLDKIILKVDELTKVLNTLNKRFLLAIKEMENNVARFGYNYANYPKETKEQLLVTIQLAQACKGILEAKILGEDGILDERIDKLLDTSNKTVKKIENLSRGISNE